MVFPSHMISILISCEVQSPTMCCASNSRRQRNAHEIKDLVLTLALIKAMGRRMTVKLQLQARVGRGSVGRQVSERISVQGGTDM